MNTAFAPSHHLQPPSDGDHHEEQTKFNQHHHGGEGFQTQTAPSSSSHMMMDLHDDPPPPGEHEDHHSQHHNNNGIMYDHHHHQEYLHQNESAYHHQHDVSYEPVVEGSQSAYHQPHVHSTSSSSGASLSHHYSHSGKPKKDLHEVELWLCSKLNNDWSSERIASQINEETLELFIDDHSHHNYDNFYNLGVSNSQLIKLRFIMCCLSIKKKQMTPTLASYFCTLFKNIIENKRGEDDWVRMMAEILYLFPEHSCIRTDIQKSILHELEMSDDYHHSGNLSDEDSPQHYFQQAIKHFQALAMKQGDENSSSTQKLSFSPATSLKPTVSKYLNVNSENMDRAMKELEEKRHFLEEYSNTDGRTLNSNLYSLRHYQPSNKHFTLRPSACKNLIEPLNYLDELENESSKKNVGVKVSPLKKITPSRPPMSSSGSTSTPTSANLLNKNKLPGLKKISSNLPSTPKTALLKTPPPSHTPTTQLISPPSATSNSAPRSVFLDDSIALQRIKEQQQNEKKRTSNKQLTEEQKQKEKERKKQEKQELKEKKEKEKLEKKKQKEELKRKQMEEKKAAQQAALANGGGTGTGRKRRKNNPANNNATQDNSDQNSMLSPSQVDPSNVAAAAGMHHMYGYLNPMFATGAGNPGSFPPFNPGQYANLLSNTFFSPGTTQQGTSQPNQAGMPSVLLPNMNPTLGNMQALGKPPQGDQTSFTQLLGINSSPNTRPPNNLLPPFAPPPGVSSFPNMLFNPGDPASMNMLMRGAQLGANPSAGQPQMRQPSNYPVNFQQQPPPTTTAAATQNPPQTAQSVVTDEERKAKVEVYLNNNILKDCNRVSEETRSKIFNFLIGNTSSDGGFEDKLLIHEEVDNDEKRQIFFHMDHTNRKWKKIMQKQNNIQPSGLE